MARMTMQEKLDMCVKALRDVKSWWKTAEGMDAFNEDKYPIGSKVFNEVHKTLRRLAESND